MDNKQNITIPEEFMDICPISDEDFHTKMSSLVKEPGFEHAIRYVMPKVDFSAFTDELLKVNSKDEFQRTIVKAFLEMLAMKTSAGISASGLSNIIPNTSYTFITNHRDIVLDASFLNLVLLREDLDTTEVAIGNNLLIFDWIETLVKLNKSFIVKRDVSMRQALEAAIQLSGYIHFTILNKNQSIWIAQREGRAKDSNDLTQESLLKMLALAGNGNTVENLMEINLFPVSISYEFDPNDYLKAKEFLLKKKNPLHKKSQRDDLFSMETGILQNKGRIHFEFTENINDRIAEIKNPDDKIDALKQVCTVIDRSIHSHYKIYPCNYIAYDKINKTERFADKYNVDDVTAFENYIESQLAKVDVADLSAEDNEYMYGIMLKMYSNPLANKLIATGK